MIYKILTRSTPSYKSLIEYILNESKNEKPETFTQNLRSNQIDIERITKEYIENESFRIFRRSDQNYLNHEILSFSDEDSSKVTPELLQSMVQKYITLRGKDGVYFGAVHRNTESVHVHICVSGLKYRTGKSHHIPKDKLKQLKIDLQTYQKEKYPELYNSLPEHGRGRDYMTDRLWYARKKDERNIQKEHIKNTINKCLNKAKTQMEFLQLLQKQNLHYYERKGIPTGIVVDNTKFRFNRLDIDLEHLQLLPTDLTEEQKTFAEIQRIRELREEQKNLSFDRN